jgi:hypothetical protein
MFHPFAPHSLSSLGRGKDEEEEEEGKQARRVGGKKSVCAAIGARTILFWLPQEPTEERVREREKKREGVDGLNL